MAEENKTVETKEAENNQTQQEPQGEQKETKEAPAGTLKKEDVKVPDGTYVKLPGWAAKTLEIGGKIAKFAVPGSLLLLGLFMGKKFGMSKASAAAAGTINDLTGKLDKANSDIALLEQKLSVPEIPQIDLSDVSSESVPGLNLETGEF